MLKKVISGWCAAPGAPNGWDPKRDGDCGALPIRVYPYDAFRGGVNVKKIEWCESAWEPTPRELEALNAGGQVVLRVHGWQVPVALYVERFVEGEPIPTLAPRPLEVSHETYQEIRRLLIADGNRGTFVRHDGREAIDLSDITVVAR